MLKGSAQLYSNGLHPTFQVSLSNNLSKRLKGYLTYSVNYQLSENQDFYDLSEEESGMSTEVVYNGETYVWTTSLQLGIPQTFATLSLARKFTNPYRKIRAAFR